jgi:hypothetical protein
MLISQVTKSQLLLVLVAMPLRPKHLLLPSLKKKRLREKIFQKHEHMYLSNNLKMLLI